MTEEKIPSIDRIKDMLTPSGHRIAVNVFDYNIAYWSDTYVQCEDRTHIKARFLLEVDHE